MNVQDLFFLMDQLLGLVLPYQTFLINFYNWIKSTIAQNNL